MPVKMRIDKVILATERRDYEFSLDGPCTLLAGPVGTGKSSLLELIKHALGGNAVLTPVVRREVRHVQLQVSLQDSHFDIKRNLGRDAGTVEILDSAGGGLLQKCSVRARLNEPSISDFLLETLGVPAVRIPRARTKSTAATVPLTFNDLFSYIYVEQQEIDRSIVHHLEVFREPKRRATFELIFGLADPELLAIEVRLGAVKDELRMARERSAAVEAFIKTANVFDEISMRDRLRQLEFKASEAAQRLSQLRDEVEAETSALSELRRGARDVESSYQAAQKAVAEVEAEVEARRQRRSQLEIDLAKSDRATIASNRLGPLEFVVCPRCLQDLDETRAAPDRCTLCLQIVQETSDMAEEDIFEASYETALSEADELLKASQISLEKVRRKAAAIGSAAAVIRNELDNATAHSVAPRFQEIELLSATQADAVAEGRSIRQLLGIWDELRELKASAEQLVAEREELQKALDERTGRLLARRSVVDDLSGIFNEVVQSLNIPWATEASLDARDYLPVINGERIESLAVAGGSKTLVTVAYHLSLLTYALSHRDSLLPQLLIIDTPRKNLGFNREDKELGERIYRRIGTIAEAYGDAVQFIVADNDVPQGANWLNALRFDYDHPLIGHVMHPGEAAVLAGEVETVGSRPTRSTRPSGSR